MVVRSACTTYCPAPRRRKNRLLTCCLLTTVPSWCTQRKPSRESTLALQTQLQPLDWPSASRKQRLCVRRTLRSTYHPLSINIECPQLNAVDTFTYLGSVISNDATGVKDVENRITKASSSFRRLQKHVWINQDTLSASKHQIIKSVQSFVITTLIYGSGDWVLYRQQVTAGMIPPEMPLLHHGYTLAGVQVLEHTNIKSIERVPMLRQLRRAGHVSAWMIPGCPRPSSGASWSIENIQKVLQRPIKMTDITGRDRPLSVGAERKIEHYMEGHNQGGCRTI